MKNSFLILSLTIFSFSFLSSQTLCDTGYFGVSGQAVSACGEPVANLSISAMDNLGTTLDSGVTDGQGFYTLCVESGKSGVVSPVSPNDYLNGVSTIDQVLIERHILGIEMFTSPFQQISADVNTTQSISTLDNVEIEKLIYQEILEFENSSSWKYISNEDELTLDAAFNAEFSHQFESITGELFGFDFTAVKIGDVDGLGCNAAVTSTDKLTTSFGLEISPNPFREESQISFSLQQSSKIDLVVTDILGREVTQYNKTYSSGDHQVSLSSEMFDQRGIYLVTLSDGRSQMTQRVIYK